MVKFEIKAYYSRGIGYVAKVDRECSVPVREIPDEQAAQYMNLLQNMGLARHETKTQIFFDAKQDCNHGYEYIFYKN